VGGRPTVIALPPLGQAQTRGVNGTKDILKHVPFDTDRSVARNAIRYVFMLTVSTDAADSMLIPCDAKGCGRCPIPLPLPFVQQGDDVSAGPQE